MSQDPSPAPADVDMTANVYENHVLGATVNPLMPDPDAIDEQFAAGANAVLQDAVELVRRLVPSHQAAAAVVVEGDFASIRKFFSLSPKYAAWAHYAVPAIGVGIHRWVIDTKQVARLTQDELVAHPAWVGFASESERHPPMRGYLAVPLLDSDGTCWGLLQLSDREDGDYTAADERAAVRFAHLVTLALGGLWDLRNERKRGLAGPTTTRG